MTPKQVRQVRDALDLTLEELGRALLVSWTTVWRWEHGGATKMDPLRRVVLEQILADLTHRTCRHDRKAERRYHDAALDPFRGQLIIEALLAARQRLMRSR
jgi:hypothetical protein